MKNDNRKKAGALLIGNALVWAAAILVISYVFKESAWAKPRYCG